MSLPRKNGWVDFDEGVCDVLLFTTAFSSDTVLPVVTEVLLHEIYQQK